MCFYCNFQKQIDTVVLMGGGTRVVSVQNALQMASAGLYGMQCFTTNLVGVIREQGLQDMAANADVITTVA